MSERIKFTVYRDTWLRGETGGLLVDGKRCCLGFLGQAVGYRDEELGLAGSPEETFVPSLWPTSLVDVSEDEDRVSVSDSPVCKEIIDVNDDEMSDGSREAQLTALFAAQGIDVEFRDGSGET